MIRSCALALLLASSLAADNAIFGLVPDPRGPNYPQVWTFTNAPGFVPTAAMGYDQAMSNRLATCQQSVTNWRKMALLGPVPFVTPTKFLFVPSWTTNDPGGPVQGLGDQLFLHYPW